MTEPLTRIEDRKLSAREAHRLLGVSPNTVYSWARRKKLDEVGLDSHGRSLYRAVDIERLARGEKVRDENGDWIEPA